MNEQRVFIFEPFYPIAKPFEFVTNIYYWAYLYILRMVNTIIFHIEEPLLPLALLIFVMQPSVKLRICVVNHALDSIKTIQRLLN